MVDVEIAGRRAAPERALADRQRQPVHDMNERDDARRLAAALHRFADRADAAPIGADAAAVRGERDILVPGRDDAVERIRHGVQEAGNRQAAGRAAIAENRRRRHEPQPRHRIIEPLRMLHVVGEGAGDAGEHVLEALARHQIAVFERGLAERGQQRIAAAVEPEIRRSRRLHQRRRQRRAALGLRRQRRRCRGPGRNRHGHRREFDDIAVLIEIVGKCGHRQPQFLARRTRGGRSLQDRPAAIATGFASGHRGTPPEDVSRSRQVYWLAVPRRFPAFPAPQRRQWPMPERSSPLTVAGAAPASAARAAYRVPYSPKIWRPQAP